MGSSFQKTAKSNLTSLAMLRNFHVNAIIGEAPAWQERFIRSITDGVLQIILKHEDKSKKTLAHYALFVKAVSHQMGLQPQTTKYKLRGARS